jgi:Protein of unknown function (DUF3224)
MSRLYDAGCHVAAPNDEECFADQDETALRNVTLSPRIKATWFVVPGSGTGDLSGLRGEGGFEGEFGKGSVGTLDYWFE